MRLFLLAALAAFPVVASANTCLPEMQALAHHQAWQQEIIEHELVDGVLWQLWLNDRGWWNVTRLENGQMCIVANGLSHNGETLEDYIKASLGTAL